MITPESDLAPFQYRSSEASLASVTSSTETLTNHFAVRVSPSSQVQLAGSRLIKPIAPQLVNRVITRRPSNDGPFRHVIDLYQGSETNNLCNPSGSLVDMAATFGYKIAAVDVFAKELEHPDYRCRSLLLGGQSDPYPLVEKQLLLTRSLLEVCIRLHQPVVIMTRNSLILRDSDLLEALALQGLCTVLIVTSSADSELNRRLGNGAEAFQNGLTVIRALSLRGIPVGAVIGPVIPAINDGELEALLAASADVGAKFAGVQSLTGVDEYRASIEQWLYQFYPGRVNHVLSSLKRYRPVLASQNQIGGERNKFFLRFNRTCQQNRLLPLDKINLNTQLFGSSDSEGQLSLLY